MQRDSSSAGVEISITRSDRWQIYQRLQDLDIPCGCPNDGGLWVSIDTPLAAIQLWSVIQHHQSPRSALSGWLQRCWQSA
jgi:hypothetical protein